jgi:hypothetical protein
MLDCLKDSSVRGSVDLGIKMFHLISEFKLQAIKHAKKLIDELCLPTLMRAHKNPKVEFPPKVKKNTFSFPMQVVYQTDSYLTKIAIPCRAYKFGLGESVKKNSKKKRKNSENLKFGNLTKF